MGNMNQIGNGLEELRHKKKHNNMNPFFSFEYLLLPPRFAPGTGLLGPTPKVYQRPPHLLIHWSLELGSTIEYRLYASTSSIFEYRCGPPSEFPLASSCSGIVHHLSGPNRRSPAYVCVAASARAGSAPSRAADRLSSFRIRPGHTAGLHLLPSWQFQGTRAWSAAEDASTDYNLGNAVTRFSCWALLGSLAITRGIVRPRLEFEVVRGDARQILLLVSIDHALRGFRNSHQVSYFTTFFIVVRVEISVAESREGLWRRLSPLDEARKGLPLGHGATVEQRPSETRYTIDATRGKARRPMRARTVHPTHWHIRGGAWGTMSRRPWALGGWDEGCVPTLWTTALPILAA
eukprot:Gb_39289 [translate_table: standard]